MIWRAIKRLFSSGKAKESEKVESAADRYQSLRDDEAAVSADTPAEDLCGISSDMGLDEIRSRLTELYRRHNRAASSLDPKLREEAEIMLDAIVELKMKYLSPDSKI